MKKLLITMLYKGTDSGFERFLVLKENVIDFFFKETHIILFKKNHWRA